LKRTKPTFVWSLQMSVFLKRFCLGVLLLLVLVLGYLWSVGVKGVVEASFPDFPDFPTPQQTLAEGDSGEIYFPTFTPFDFDVLLAGAEHGRPTTGLGTLYLPETASPDAPVPGMVVLHGSGGIREGREQEYGKLLAENGYAAFVLDYYAPRGATDDLAYMIRVLSVTEFDAIADAYAALRLLGTHPSIDGQRVGVVGFSYGGMAARFALDVRVKAKLAGAGPGFAAHVDYYGPCFQNLGTTQTTGASLLTLRGDQDASNDMQACRLREEELRSLGTSVEAHVFPGVGHAWDVDVPAELSEDSPYVAGCEVVYDENGHSFVGGIPVVQVPLETPRTERIALRITSGSVMKDCVKYGYIIGRDEMVKQQTDKLLLKFLKENL
jgi:dienelactone hydrolase